MNNNFDLVDSVAKEMGGTATFFVKHGENFVRVTTNVKKSLATRRRNPLDPNGKVIVNIRNNEPYYGEATILGKTCPAAYRPMRRRQQSYWHLLRWVSERIEQAPVKTKTAPKSAVFFCVSVS